MKIENLVRTPPVSFDDLEGMAGWLESLALQGLYYDGRYFSRYFFTSILFKQGPPAKVRYRIDPSKGSFYGDPPPGLVELYEESGWKYVDSPTRFCHIFMSEDQNAPEPYDQPDTLAQAMDPMIKGNHVSLFLAGVLFFAELVLLCYVIYSGITLRRPAWFYAAGVVLLVLAWTVSFLRTRRLASWKEQLEQGQETKPYLPNKNTGRMLFLVLLTVLLILVRIWIR